MSVDVLTFGCRLNIHESEVIRRDAAGLSNTTVVNTCAVTGEAVRQARQAAGPDAALRVLELDGESRIPERRAVLAPYEDR